MGKMKELAIQLANENHGNWNEALCSEMLDDDYRENQFKTKKKEIDVVDDYDGQDGPLVIDPTDDDGTY